jgi:hypothetical protein
MKPSGNARCLLGSPTTTVHKDHLDHILQGILFINLPLLICVVPLTSKPSLTITYRKIAIKAFTYSGPLKAAATMNLSPSSGWTLLPSSPNPYASPILTDMPSLPFFPPRTPLPLECPSLIQVSLHARHPSFERPSKVPSSLMSGPSIHFIEQRPIRLFLSLPPSLSPSRCLCIPTYPTTHPLTPRNTKG